VSFDKQGPVLRLGPHWLCSRSSPAQPSQSYGAHIDDYPEPYLTAAAAIGMREVNV
jgi:hypothetical protein